MSAVLAHLVGMLRALTSRIVEFSTLAVKNRIHSELLRMARDSGGGGAYLISPAPTQSEIAQRISTHREAVSREISRLKQIGIIERRGRVLAVKDFERLTCMVLRGDRRIGPVPFEVELAKMSQPCPIGTGCGDLHFTRSPQVLNSFQQQ